MFGSFGEKSNLTEKQLLFWLGHALNPSVELDTDATSYGFHIDGEIDVDRFQNAFQTALEDFAALRTVIYTDSEGIPQQRIPPKIDHKLEFNIIELSLLNDWIIRRVSTPIDINKALFSTALLQVEPNRFFWFFKYHHLIGDATSVAILFKRVSDIYLALTEGRIGELELEYKLGSYLAFLDYETERRKSIEYSNSIKFWKAKLNGHSSGLKADLYETSKKSVEISADFGRSICDFSVHQGLRSPAIIFLGVVSACLMATNQSFSSTLGLNLRDRPSSFENTFGLFVSTCPLKIDASPDLTFIDCARMIQSNIDEVSKYTQSLVPNPMHERIWNVLFNYLHLNFATFAGIPLRVERHLSIYSNKAMNIQAKAFQGTSEFSIDLFFAKQLYTPSQQERFVDGFLRVLKHCLAHPQSRLVEISKLFNESTFSRFARREISVDRTSEGRF